MNYRSNSDENDCGECDEHDRDECDWHVNIDGFFHVLPQILVLKRDDRTRTKSDVTQATFIELHVVFIKWGHKLIVPWWSSGNSQVRVNIYETAEKIITTQLLDCSYSCLLSFAVNWLLRRTFPARQTRRWRMWFNQLHWLFGTK